MFRIRSKSPTNRPSQRTRTSLLSTRESQNHHPDGVFSFGGPLTLHARAPSHLVGAGILHLGGAPISSRIDVAECSANSPLGYEPDQFTCIPGPPHPKSCSATWAPVCTLARALCTTTDASNAASLHNYPVPVILMVGIPLVGTTSVSLWG